MAIKQNGFTIVEILVTIVLIGITFGSISYMFIAIENVQTQTGYVDNATRAAQSEIESLRNNNYDALVSGTTINFTTTLPPGLPPGSSGSAVITEPTNGLRRVDATVTYSFGGQTRKVTLSSLIGVIGIAQ